MNGGQVNFRLPLFFSLRNLIIKIFIKTYRRQRPVPADLTRFENFAIYWNGRAKGLDYSQPFLFEVGDILINQQNGVFSTIPILMLFFFSRKLVKGKRINEFIL